VWHMFIENRNKKNSSYRINYLMGLKLINRKYYIYIWSTCYWSKRWELVANLQLKFDEMHFHVYEYVVYENCPSFSFNNKADLQRCQVII
jgi:hypothetical protein